MGPPFLIKVLEDGTLNVETQKFQEILSNLPEKFLILSIVGDRFSGKFFFVNKIMKFLNPSMENHGFPYKVDIGENSENGIRIWPNTFKIKLAGHPDSNVLILDIDSRWGNLKFSENYSLLEIFCLAVSSLTIYLDKNEPDSAEIDTFINSASFHLPNIYNSLQFPRKIIYLQNKWSNNPQQRLTNSSPKLKKIVKHLDKLLGTKNSIFQLENLFLDPLKHNVDEKFLNQNELEKIISVILAETENCRSFEKKNFFEIIDWVVQAINSGLMRHKKKDSKFDQKDQKIGQNSSKNDELGILKREIFNIITQNCINYAIIFVEPKYREKFLEILCGKISFELSKRPIFKSNKYDQIFSWALRISDKVLKNWQEILDPLDKMSIMIDNEFDNNGAFSNEDLPELLFRAKKFANSRYTVGVNQKKDEVFDLFLHELRSNFQKRNQNIIEKEGLIAEEIMKILVNFYSEETSAIAESSEISAKHEEISKILYQVFISTCQKKSLQVFWQNSGIQLVNKINQLRVNLDKNLELKKADIQQEDSSKEKVTNERVSYVKVIQNSQTFSGNDEKSKSADKIQNFGDNKIGLLTRSKSANEENHKETMKRNDGKSKIQNVEENQIGLTRSKSANEENLQDIMKIAAGSYEKKVSEYLGKSGDINKKSFESFLVNAKLDAFRYLNSNLPQNLYPDLKLQIQSEFEYKIDLLRMKFINEVQMHKQHSESENRPVNEDQENEIKAGDILKKAIELYDEKISEFFEKGGKNSNEAFTTAEGNSRFKAVQYFNSNLPQILSSNSEPLYLYRDELYKELEMKKSNYMTQLKQSGVENRAKKPEKPGNLKKIAIGIHFGTEYIRCGTFANSKFEIIKTTEGDGALRNFVTILQVEGKRRYLVGNMAQNTYLKNQEKFTVQDYGNGSLVALEKNVSKSSRLEFIIGFLLWEIFKMVKNVINCDIGTCVIVLPISSHFLFRNVVKNAGQIVGFKKVHIVTEPMAAAYSCVNKFGAEQTWPFLVLSYGKNQFDSTILDAKLNGGKIYATSGKYILGTYKGHQMSMLEEDSINFEENIQITTHSLNTLENGGKFYGILVGDIIPSDLTPFKKNIRKYFPTVNMVEDINLTEGIVHGASILADKISMGIIKIENFHGVNPFDLWIFNPNGESFFYLKRNSEIPLEKVVKLNNNFGGKFQFRDSKGSLRDFIIDSRVGDLWIKIDTSGLLITKLVDGIISGCVEEINFLEERTIQDIKLKFQNYLFYE